MLSKQRKTVQIKSFFRKVFIYLNYTSSQKLKFAASSIGTPCTRIGNRNRQSTCACGSKSRMKAECNFERYSSAKFKLHTHKYARALHPTLFRCIYLCSLCVCVLSDGVPPLLGAFSFLISLSFECATSCVCMHVGIYLCAALISMHTCTNESRLLSPRRKMHLSAHTHEGKEKEIETFEINQTLSHSLAPPQIIKTLNASAACLLRTSQKIFARIYIKLRDAFSGK